MRSRSTTNSPEMVVALSIWPLELRDRDWVLATVADAFATPHLVSRGVFHHADDLPGLVAEQGGEPVGLVLYRMEAGECEVVALVSVREGRGVGSSLLEEAARIAKEAGCHRVWRVTTNDNVHAMDFYRKRGWRQVAIHRGAMTEARKLKPELPEIGQGGVRIEDEVEYELRWRDEEPRR